MNTTIDISNTNGYIKRKNVFNKTRVGLFSIVQKELKPALFHTSQGERIVNPIVSCILVESYKGVIEMIAGTKMADSNRLIRKLINENIAFEDIPTVIELNCNYEAIDKSIESKLKYNEENNITFKEAELEVSAYKEVAITTEEAETSIEEIKIEAKENIIEPELEIEAHMAENIDLCYIQTFIRIKR